MCKFTFSTLSKRDSPGATNIETDVQQYNQKGSEFRVCNINGRAMLPDSTVPKFVFSTHFSDINTMLSDSIADSLDAFSL